MGINGIEPNPHALICPVNTNLTKHQYDELIEIKKKTGCANLNMSEYVRVKIIQTFITRMRKKI